MKTKDTKLYTYRIVFGIIFLMIGRFVFDSSVVYQQSIERTTDPLLTVLVWSFIYTIGITIGLMGIIILGVTFVRAINPNRRKK